MSENAYELLAGALDALPNRFPRTPSGVEIRLLKKVFTEEEARLASQMSRTYRTAADIAKQARLAEAEVTEMLLRMARHELVKRKSADGADRFRLGPFIFGWYESHMPRMDAEFAQLFEQYVTEGGGERILSPRPGILGVIPVRGSLKPELLQPYDDIDAHFRRYERFLVMDCVCRVQQNLLGRTCRMPVKRCAFVGMPPNSPVSENILNREQAFRLFCELEEMGHVHLGFYGFIAGAESPQFVGCCNCCCDCCGILRGIGDLGLSESPQRSNYRAVVNLEDCITCGNCIERCPVHAIVEGKDGQPELNRSKCIGCGHCVVKCSGDALQLEPVAAAEWFHIPSSFEEWEEIRMRNLD